MIYMTAEQAAEMGLLDMDIRPNVAVVSESKLAEIVANHIA